MLDKLLESFPKWHQQALLWFHNQRGHEIGWPTPLSDGTLLSTKAKGIYKPKGYEYALSVRQTLSARYPDKEPVHRPDGTWRYEYFQEADDPSALDSEYTNRGLMACIRDQVPIGVMRQTRGKPNVRYHVLGIAMVQEWTGGYFILEGVSPIGKAQLSTTAVRCDAAARLEAQAAYRSRQFDPKNEADARERTIASIVRRRGQPAFREALVKAYSSRCVMTGCDAVAALEAAHIIPYRGDYTNALPNGLLLRADVHTLFDLGLIAVDINDPEGLRVIISPTLAGTTYASLEGQLLLKPDDSSADPSREALEQHRTWAGL